MDYSRLFRQHDHPTHTEAPPGFDYKETSKRFQKFLNDLSTKLKMTLPSETGYLIQDASFHSEVTLPLPNKRHAFIRFSNFGNMVTVGNVNFLSERMTVAVLELFEIHGYIYVPESELAAEYTGSNPGVSGIRNWWIRYFDWI